MIKALPSLFPHLLGTANNARVEFYDKFQREADEYDRDFIKKYDEDLNTTLIFVGFLFFIHPGCDAHLAFRGWGRPVCSPRSHLLSLSMSRANSSRITHNSVITSSQSLQTSRLGIPRLTSMLLCLSGLSPLLPSSTFKPSFTQVWQLPSSLHSLPCWASSGSISTPGWRCVGLSSTAVGTDSAR